MNLPKTIWRRLHRRRLVAQGQSCVPLPTVGGLAICLTLLGLMVLPDRVDAHGGESHAEPVEGFIVEQVSEGWDAVTGFCFGPNAAGTKVRQYVWEKNGKVWIFEDGQKLATPLIDLSEEVANWRDHGLLGFALDPDFRSNGYIYLLYAVDRHHLLHFGTPSYDPNASEPFAASIGRLTRYRAEAQNDFLSVDPASRTVLIGDTASTGIPILFESHGVGTLAFAKDGSLLVSCGDGASHSGIDIGGEASGAYVNDALADGIISAEHNVGAFRSQLIDSLNGKILRINPQTGAGYPSNPFYEVGDPGSVASRVWTLGLRNPFRFALRSSSGSHAPSEGDPGMLLIGDVGWNAREEVNVVDVPGRNAGWPIYEGMDVQPAYEPERPAGIPQVPTWRPMLDWKWDSRVCLDNITVATMSTPASPVLGTSFGGSASIGGVWYDGESFPENFHDTYFFSDVNGKWIRNLKFNSANQLQEVRPVVMLAGQVTGMNVHPETGELYYVEYPDTIHRVFYAPGGNQLPNAVASVDVNHGPAPLVSVFRGDQSSDPIGQPLTYHWDFGDGSPPSLSANPVHVFQSPGSGPVTYTVTLTVSDCCGGSDQTQLIVSVNNSPPQVQITSPIDGTRYPLDGGDIDYPLEATVTDAEDDAGALTYEWQTTLHHNDHVHIEPSTMGASSSSIITPVGGDGGTYFYRITLKVTDTAGLTTLAETFLYPDEPGTPIFAYDDGIAVAFGGTASLDVLANDRGAMHEVDLASVNIVSAPSHGVAVLDPQTGAIDYTHNGSLAAHDEFAYSVSTESGVVSNVATVRVNFEGGLKGEYFSDADLTQLAMTRTDPEINFDWWLGSPGSAVPQDQFSVRWTGSVIPEAAGAYTFYATADDGVRLWVNDQPVIDAWGGPAGEEVSGTINLVGGQPASIRLEYHDVFWNAIAELRWSGDFQSKEIISRHDLIPVLPADAQPAVQITAPANGTTVMQGTPVDLVASASAVAGDAIAQVEFLADGTVVGTATAEPFQVSWTPSAQGSVAMVARATSVNGVSGDSSAFPVTIIVEPPNEPPTASADAYEIYPGASTSLAVIANDLDVDGQLDPASVEIVTQPGQGTASVDSQSGAILYQHNGIGGSGGADSFSYRVADDLGAFSNTATVSLTVVRSWSGWQSQNPGAGSTPLANGDGDSFVDLLEFALGGDPFSGAVGQAGLRLEEGTGGAIDAVVVRPEGIGGVNTTLEVSADLAQWTEVNSPNVSSLGGGLEELRFANVSGLGGASRSRGFARLKVDMVEAGVASSARTLPKGWYETVFTAGYQTYGLSLPQPSVFGGTVGAIDLANIGLLVPDANLATVLDAGRAYYLEFVSGALEGHRLDVDVAMSSGDLVALLPGSPHSTLDAVTTDATGASFVIRPHDTIGDAFDKNLFHGSNRSAQADRVMFFTAAGYESYFLLKVGATYDFWVSAGDSDLESRQAKVISPGLGAFVIRRTGEPLPLLRLGEVRDFEFVQPLRVGYNLIAEPVPLDRSPASRRMTLADGFTGGLKSSTSDLIYQWKGDADPSASGFDTCYLLNHVAPYQYWTSSADSSLPNFDEQLLFRDRRATFVRLLNVDRPDYKVAPGWDPLAP